MSNRDRFTSDGSDVQFISPCQFCRHKNKDTDTCVAFPQGIPSAILTGKNSHNKPYPGDNGIQFEPAEVG